MKYTQYKLGMMTALCIGMNVQVVDASPVDTWRAQYQEAKTLLNEKKYDEYKK